MASKNYKQEKRFIQRLVVKVSSLRGALEMMRYDSCFPEDEQDALGLYNIEASGVFSRVINFTRVGRTPEPTIDRWASRSCEVLRVENPDVEPIRR